VHFTGYRAHRQSHKEFVLFEEAGHFVPWTQPDKILRELVARVRPLIL
jgi:pimeloyl-ACP methyl ester carboxylesterase